MAASAGPSGARFEQAESIASAVPRMADAARRWALRGAGKDMWAILLEAFGALVLLLVIVWWTMFSGRRRGERRDDEDTGR